MDSDCLLGYEYNNILRFANFQPNTTKVLSLEGITLSSSYFEISTFVNSTQVTWKSYFKSKYILKYRDQ